MNAVTPHIDRPAAIRKALRDLVSEHGFHGTSMSAVAKTAGVATGTAYVHYESKEELIYATYIEIKRDLSDAVLAEADLDAEPREFYRQMWRATYEHFREQPERARFLTQLEESPFFATANERLRAQGDPFLEQTSRPDIVDLLVPLPPELLYKLSIGLAVRLAASGTSLSDDELEIVVNASLRAITVDAA